MIKIEDAISNLKNQILRFEKGTEPYIALQMAIKALEQEPILDRIRAEIEREPYVSKMEVLEIIDKYKEESEEPTDEQPEIVRCKDCKHREAENGFCEGRGWPMQLVPDDGFCEKGERRS